MGRAVPSLCEKKKNNGSYVKVSQNVGLFGEWIVKEVVKLKRSHRGGSWSNRTDVLNRRGHLDIDTSKVKVMGRHREETATCKPQRGAATDSFHRTFTRNRPANISVSNLQPPLWCLTPSLWYFLSKPMQTLGLNHVRPSPISFWCFFHWWKKDKPFSLSSFLFVANVC